jgi:hypothetical protein
MTSTHGVQASAYVVRVRETIGYSFSKSKTRIKEPLVPVISNTSNGPVTFMRKITKDFGSYLI